MKTSIVPSIAHFRAEIILATFAIIAYIGIGFFAHYYPDYAHNLFVAVFLFLALLYCAINFWTARRDRQRGWRVRMTGRAGFYYEELVNEQWRGISIDSEMQSSNKPGYIIYFQSAQEWPRAYPDWASHRREEIIARIKDSFPPSRCAYEND